MALTQPELQALRRFTQLPEGRLILSVLGERLAMADEKLRRLHGDDLYRMQGRALELEELITLLTTAGDSLNRQEQPVRVGPRPGARALA